MASREFSRIPSEFKGVIEKHLENIPVKLGAIATELGLSVKLSTLNPGESGKIYREGDGYVIKINRHESRERQRFTLAHEISHFLLHRDIIDSMEDGITDNVLYRSGAPENIEFEANRLAADLVMPAKSVHAALNEIGGAVSEEIIGYIANQFNVSKAAMEIRLSPFVA